MLIYPSIDGYGDQKVRVLFMPALVGKSTKIIIRINESYLYNYELFLLSS